MKARRMLCLMVIFSVIMTVFLSWEQTDIQAATKKTKLNKTSITVYVGNSKTLKMLNTSKKVKWSSNKTKVAVVSSNGKVTGKKAGETFVTAKIGNKKYKCKVVVKPAQTPKAPVLKEISLYDKNNVKLQWGKSKGAEKYKVYRKKSDGKFVLVKTTQKTTYHNKSLAYETKYTYKVMAVSKSGKVSVSKLKSITTGKKSELIYSVVNHSAARDHERIGDYAPYVSNQYSDRSDLIASTLWIDECVEGYIVMDFRDGRRIDSNLLTDGTKLYFAVIYEKLIKNPADLICNGVVYECDMKTKKCKQIASIDGMSGLAGYYDNVLYVNKSVYDPAGSGRKVSLYSYNLVTEQTSLIKTDYTGEKQYGSYIIGTDKYRHNPNVSYMSIDLKSLKMYQLPYANDMHPMKEGIYYNYYSEDAMTNTIAKCTFTGENESNLMTYQNRYICYLGTNSVGLSNDVGGISIYRYEELPLI